MRHLPYEENPKFVKEHPKLAAALAEGIKEIDEYDGEYWVNNTIDWLIKAVSGICYKLGLSLTRSRAKDQSHLCTLCHLKALMNSGWAIPGMEARHYICRLHVRRATIST